MRSYNIENNEFLTYDLDDINQAYADMQERKTIKSMVVVSRDE